MGKLSTKERDDLPANMFALSSKRMFPIHDKQHIKMAWDMVSRAKGLSTSERETSRKNILAAAKKTDIDTSDWDKKAINDTFIADCQILADAAAESTDGPLKVRFKATRANIVNENNRLYPLDVLTDAISKANESYAKSGKMVGESPHPKVGKGLNGQIVFDTKIENSVIKISNVFMEESEAYLDAEVLETSKGKDLKALIKQGVPVGISMRAVGDSVKRNINGKFIDVATFLDITSFDVVMNPATEGCGAVEILTDSQVTEILDSDPVIDGIQVDEPICPSCNAKLEGVDGDNDSDVDFYVCPNGHGPFVQDMSMYATVSANTTLTLVTPFNWEKYDLARQYMATKTAAGSTMKDSKIEGGNEIMTIEELRKAMQDDPEVRKAMTTIASETAKPALDAIEVQKAEEEKEKVKVEAKVEAKAFVDEKVKTLEGKFDTATVKIITDAVGTPPTKEQAELVFDAAVKAISDSAAAKLLEGAGFTGKTTGEGGQVRVEVGETAKPWMDNVEKITKAFDEYGSQFGKTIDPELRKYNKKFVDKILGRYEEAVGGKVLTDSVEGFEHLTDSVSVTTSQLLNQPTILTAVLVQAFQDVESLQFMMADTFGGSEWRIPVETFVSGGIANPATGLIDILVPEGNGIPESAINLTWQSFSPTWRRNAVSLTTDVIKQLADGPAKYEAIARAIYHIGEDKRRKLDNAAYYEMILASDEYAAKAVTSEAVPANQITAVSNSTNVVYKANLTLGGAATSTAGSNPIVRPRTKNVLQANGSVQQVTTNTFGITVSGSALVMGYLDGSGNVAGANATFAIDFENGVVYFTTNAGLAPTASTPILPVASYSAVTNYDRWSNTVTTGEKPEDYYNTFLQKLTNVSALMGSAPRYKKPNIAIMSLNAATYIENASIFYKLASPEGTRIIPTGNYFGERSNMNLAKINSPWVAGDGRVLLTQKGSTRYGVETAYQIEGPYPKYDTNGNIIDAKVWYGRENSVLATPQVTDASGNIINPVSRTLKITA